MRKVNNFLQRISRSHKGNKGFKIVRNESKSSQKDTKDLKSLENKDNFIYVLQKISNKVRNGIQIFFIGKKNL